MSDPDQAGVYAAEQYLRKVLEVAEQVEDRTYDFHGYEMQLPDERKFGDLASIQRYYDQVCGLSSVQDAYPGCRAPKVRERRGGSAAHYSYLGHQVAICTKPGQRFALREVVVLHELAHALAPLDGHGPKFRGAFVFLVEKCMGPELAMVLGAMLYEETGAPHRVWGLQNC